MTPTRLTLSQRPQCGHNFLPIESSRFTPDGRLIVKNRDGKWVSYARFVAQSYAERKGVNFPASGIRVEMLDPQDVRPSKLVIKIHQGKRYSLKNWVKAQ